MTMNNSVPGKRSGFYSAGKHSKPEEKKEKKKKMEKGPLLNYVFLLLGLCFIIFGLVQA